MTNNYLPKWAWMTIGILVIAFLFLTTLEKLHTVAGKTLKRGVPDNTISMSAEGKVAAVPDLATIDLGVSSTATTAKKAQDETTKKSNQITQYLKDQGVDAADMTTTQLNVYPTYDYSRNQPTITGYQATQSLNVKVHGVDKSTDMLGKLIDGVTTAGANQINGISLGFEDADNLRQEARKRAIEKAKQKAQELAHEAGLRLGRVVSISESSMGYPPPMPYAYGMGGDMAMETKNAVQVSPGSQDITATITVIFEVK